jgi:hypothetical protein
MPGIGELYETTNPPFQDLRCFPIPKFPSQIVYYKPLRDGVVSSVSFTAPAMLTGSSGRRMLQKTSRTEQHANRVQPQPAAS